MDEVDGMGSALGLKRAVLCKYRKTKRAFGAEVVAIKVASLLSSR